MKRYCLLFSYDGTDYCGWQVQPNCVTVQSVLEEGLQKAFSQPIKTQASGRTDAGVHAVGQICHFDAETTIPAERIADAVNPFLPSSVQVLKSAYVPDSFDCTRSAKRKTYGYTVYQSERTLPLLERYAVQVRTLPSAECLQNRIRILEGEHDFKAFCASGSSVLTTVRTVYAITLEQKEVYGVPVFTFHVCGNGFLYHMVRILVGTLLAAEGRISSERIEKALRSGERALSGKTMPAKGLVLERVEYTPSPFDKRS